MSAAVRHTRQSVQASAPSLWKHRLSLTVEPVRAMAIRDIETAPQDEGVAPDPRAPRAVSLRAVLVALALVWLCGYWIRQAEIVALACQITEAVPAVPALVCLLALLAANLLLKRLRLLRPLSRAELAAVYIFVAVATTMFGCGIARFLIACLTAPFYFSSPTAPLEVLTEWIPPWLSPADPEVHRWLYEGSPTGAVPWGPWTAPILFWSGFFVLFAFVLSCLMALVSDSWAQGERLVFPLVRLPLQIIEDRAEGESFFRSRATWYGVGAALLINLIAIVRGVYFGGGGGGLYIDLGQGLTAPPWNALRPLSAYFRPELIGLGYLISTELSLSIWVFFLLTRVEALILAMVGYRMAGQPFPQEQSIGAYVVLGLVLLWKVRSPLLQALRSWWTPDASRASRAPGWAAAGALGGFVALCALARMAGLAVWLAVVYFAILILVALVYARLRAETGVPLVWMFPYSMQTRVLHFFLGSRRIAGTGVASHTIFSLLVFLSRGYFPTVAGYQIEGLQMARETRISRHSMIALLLAAVGVGALVAFIFHFAPYYAHGAVGLRGGLWGSEIARSEFEATWRATQLPVPPDTPRIIATLSGAGLLALLAAVRGQWLSCPLHPLGYAMATAYGRLIWAPFFLVWLFKSLILRYAGSKAYLRALPGFLGFALGHFIIAGAIWGALGAALGGRFLLFGVWFG